VNFCPACGSKLILDNKTVGAEIRKLRHEENIGWAGTTLSFLGAIAFLTLVNYWDFIGFSLESWAATSTFLVIVLLAVVGVISGIYSAYVSHKKNRSARHAAGS